MARLILVIEDNKPESDITGSTHVEWVCWREPGPLQPDETPTLADDLAATALIAMRERLNEFGGKVTPALVN